MYRFFKPTLGISKSSQLKIDYTDYQTNACDCRGKVLIVLNGKLVQLFVSKVTNSSYIIKLISTAIHHNLNNLFDRKQKKAAIQTMLKFMEKTSIKY